MRLSVLGSLVFSCFWLPQLALGQAITEFPVSGPGFGPVGIAAGSDGALWFTESTVDKIGRITTNGVMTEFTLPTANSFPTGIAAGPDGALWFTEQGSSKIGRITTAGVITEFALPSADSVPYRITTGPDGALWFTENTFHIGQIGRITTAGVITEFAVPSVATGSSDPSGIVAGPDGALWFTEFNGGKIGRITTAGIITEFNIPTHNSGPEGIAAGSDGALWFTEEGSAQVGRITTAGVITEFAVDTYPFGITAGPDGALWFTQSVSLIECPRACGKGNKIGRITTAGIVTEFNIPTPGSGSEGIAAGSDGALWFTESNVGKIGRITTTGGCPADINSLCLNDNRFRVQVACPAALQATDDLSGISLPLTSNTGAFWFFSPDNLELVIKVLDGRSINGKWWVFYGSLTNVEFTITVTDTETGAQKAYFNPQGQLASVADTSAFQ